MAEIIDGKAIALKMQEEMKQKVEELKIKGVVPGLAAILVGDDPASQTYVRSKEKACERIGIFSDVRRLPVDIPEKDLISLVQDFNTSSKIHGILVQLPLPRHIDEEKVLLLMNPDKDVDGFHPVSVGKMVIGTPGFLPCTPHGIQVLLIRSGVETKGKHVVVVGRSNIVGKPIANILLQKKIGANAIVTVVHTAASDMSYFTRQADILIVAAGRPEMITGDMVKDGVVVIDVGMNRVDDTTKERGYRLTGDVDFASVSQKASKITPVPGGVGPMTITMLLHNTIESAARTIA
ncbi:MAG: bifunctional methylenetetrahydrofolate dehydrogenase/methenyltetrahydrofolate cyclohydrolase FolD [Candidatus Latescibacteria bacterium]|nr:bifunctional methylenetetrahydrofolate dehydrogenase/methenyltetrahydrofolate cyclohydrolase FolD [Candidatus Latescibacterota bacterium]